MNHTIFQDEQKAIELKNLIIEKSISFQEKCNTLKHLKKKTRWKTTFLNPQKNAELMNQIYLLRPKNN